MPTDAPVHEQSEASGGPSLSDGSLVSWELRSHLSAGTWATGDGYLRAELLREELSFQPMAPQMEPFSQAISASRPSSAQVSAQVLREPDFEYAFSMAYEDEEAPGLFDIVRVSEDSGDASHFGLEAQLPFGSVRSPSGESWRLVSVCSSVPESDHESADMGSIANAFRATVRMPFHAGRVALAESARGAAIEACGGYARLRDQAAEVDLEARQAYEALLAPHAQGAPAVAQDQLGAAHAAAQAAANAHAAAEEAARALRSAYVAYAAHAFAAADSATNTHGDFMERGWAALQVVEDALLMEAHHRLLRGVFEAATVAGDPCQPLQPESALAVGDRQAQEQAVRFANRDLLPPGEDGGEEDAPGAGGISYGEVRAVAEEAAGAWRQHWGYLDTALRFDGAFLAAQNEEGTWLRSLLRPLWEAGPEDNETLRAVKTEIIAALQAALAADVTPALRAAQSVFLLVASSSRMYAARSYVTSLAHLIHISLAAPHGALPLVPRGIPLPAVSHYFTHDDDQISNAFDARTRALRAAKDLSDLLDRLLSVLLVIQSVPAFRFPGSSEAP